MRTRELADTGVRLTELGFGAASLGNLYRETSATDAADAVEAAWELGIRYFDTAPHYGLGLSEHRLGDALLHRPRADYVVSTKVGRLLVPNEAPTGHDSEGFIVPDDTRRQWDFSYDGIMRSLEASLGRLNLDAVDILYLHDPDQHSEESAWQGAEVLSELKAQGVIRARGIGTNTAVQLPELFAADAVDVAMLAGRYTLLEQHSALAALDAAAEYGKSIVAVGVFNSGLLAETRPKPTATYDYAVAAPELIDAALRLADECERNSTTLPAAAIAFPLRHPSIANITLGMRSASQVERNCSLFQTGVPDSLWHSLSEDGLLP